jgi:hypothetical protein
MLNAPPWNHPWFIDQGRHQITREVGQLDEHLALTALTSPVRHSRSGISLSAWLCTVGSA